MSDIVVSYDRRDKDRVAFLVEEIRRRGWEVWWDRDLQPADDFADTVQQKINEARCVLVVWTSYSVESRWVRSEATLAHDRHILIPVLLDVVDIPIPFNTIDAIDLASWPDTPSIAEMERLVHRVATIKTTLDETAPRAQPDNPRLSTRLATKVLNALKQPGVSVRAKRCAMENTPRANAAYTTGLAFYNQLSTAGLQRAQQLFLEVIEIAPSHADAASRLTRCWHWTHLSGVSGTDPSVEVERDDVRYRDALEIALADPDEQNLVEYARFVLLPCLLAWRVSY